MVDDWIAFKPSSIAELSDAQLLMMLRWWQTNGDVIYEREHKRHNLGYDPDKRQSGVVYFAQRSDSLVKIGFSTQPINRYKRLEKIYGERLEIILEIEAEHPFELEQEIHAELGAFHIEGEWFDLPPYVLAQMAKR